MKAISSGELDRMNHVDGNDFVLINVVPRDAFNEKHIRTSINIPVDDSRFIEKVEAIAGSKDREIVVYCGSFEDNASPKAAQKLERAGFTHVYDLEGGTRDWFQFKKPELDEA